MAISTVSSISAGGFVRLFRAPTIGSTGPLSRGPAVNRVEAVPSLAVREDSRRQDAAQPDPAAQGEKEEQADKLRGGALDPRRPESIVGAAKPSENEIRSRIDELQGEKSALDRKQVERNGQRSAEVMEVLSQLKARDGEVRAHEAAHMAAGGRYITGGATYSYERGPDGAEYAVGGEVGVDTSPVPGDPEATAEKMRIVRAAALAPSEPSGADLAVAAAASEAENAALAEMAQARSGEAALRYGREADSGKRGGEAAPARNILDMVA